VQQEQFANIRRTSSPEREALDVLATGLVPTGRVVTGGEPVGPPPPARTGQLLVAWRVLRPSLSTVETAAPTGTAAPARIAGIAGGDVAVR